VKHFKDICAVALNRKAENGDTDFECELFPVKFGRARAATSAPLSQGDTFLGKNEWQVLEMKALF
jgi:hypothetical protein